MNEINWTKMGIIMMKGGEYLKIGIPRALFFYKLYPFWKVFFENLDQEIILSKMTNKNIVEKGLELAVDDACLPVKIFHGHVEELKDKVDILFIPRIVSIEPREYICPKFLGLPDMIKVNIKNLPEIMDTKLNLYKGNFGIFNHIFEIGNILEKTKSEVIVAYYKALKYFNNYKKTIKVKHILPADLLTDVKYFESKGKEGASTFKILLLGHPYILYDHFINMNIITKLRKSNVEIITSEMVHERNIEEETKKFSKDMFWTLGKDIMGSAFYFLDNNYIDGIINVASFGCGPDSLVGELLEHKVRQKYDTPFLYLNIDEQSGEAGLNTRLEAFIDILERRKQLESNISTYG